MKRLLLCVFFASALVAGVADAQPPVEPIDIEIVALNLVSISPVTISMSADLRFRNTLGVPANYSTEILFLLDGVPVATVPVHFAPDASTCDVDNTCSVVCDLEGNHCSEWNTWSGAGCNPADPENTCFGVIVCACTDDFVIPANGDNNGELMAEVIVDPDDTMAEADETNNSMSVPIGSVPVHHSTWGAIKALYQALLR